MKEEITKEPQYQRLLSLRREKGLVRMGLSASQVWRDDPRRLCFVLSRYKFVAKMLSGKERVLEVGCGDAFAARIVQQEVGALVAVDFDPVFVEDVNDRQEDPWRFDCRVHDILSGPVEGVFDAAYSLDVIEHIPERDEDAFLSNISASLRQDAALLVGTPSIQSNAYASEQSRQGHVNLKDHRGLRALMEKYFLNVFLFSMNDEVVHTGFYPMAHYLIAMGVGKRTPDATERRA